MKKQVADLQAHVEAEVRELKKQITAKAAENQAQLEAEVKELHKVIETRNQETHNHCAARTTETNTQVKNLAREMLDMKKVLSEIKNGVHAMNHRHILREERSKYQHQMLFNAIKKVAGDVKEMKDHQDNDDEMQVDECPSINSPGKTKAMENRQNFERILNHHVEAMNKTNDFVELKKAGELAVKYSDELFKNFL
jgi:hypothetical protein